MALSLAKQDPLQIPQIQKPLHKLVTNVWNSLPSEVVSAQSVNSFKNRLDRHWRASTPEV